MSQLSISEVARLVGLRASAIRYYEQIGILKPAGRKSGKRLYDSTVLRRLAVIQRAQETGFTLVEIRELLFGFSDQDAPPKRWQGLAERKLAELDAAADRIELMKRLLNRLRGCNCSALDECGEKLLKQRGIAL